MEDLIDEEIVDLANAWTSPKGLILQQRALASVWEDPALDAYDHD